MQVAAATLLLLRCLTLSAYFLVLPLSSHQQGDHYEHHERTRRTYHGDGKHRAWVLEPGSGSNSPQVQALPLDKLWDLEPVTYSMALMSPSL